MLCLSCVQCLRASGRGGEVYVYLCVCHLMISLCISMCACSVCISCGDGGSETVD